MVKLQITEQERALLINELAEHIKQLTYMNARKRAEEAIDALLRNVKDQDIDPNTPIDIALYYQFLVKDLIQIIGKRHLRLAERYFKQAENMVAEAPKLKEEAKKHGEIATKLLIEELKEGGKEA